MYPKFWISTLGLSINMDGVCYGMGILVAIVWMFFRLKEMLGTASARRMIFGYSLLCVVLGLLGAKLLYAALFPAKFWPYWWLVFNGPGLSLYGALLGMLLATVLVARQYGQSAFFLGDRLSPPVAILLACKRVGCFLAGCCYGIPTTLPWGVRFPAGHPTHGVPVHPTELYECAFLVLLAYGLVWFERAKKPFTGAITLLFLGSYALWRFAVEFIRGDRVPGPDGLSVIQWVCLAVAIAVVAGWVWRKRSLLQHA